MPAIGLGRSVVWVFLIGGKTPPLKPSPLMPQGVIIRKLELDVALRLKTLILGMDTPNGALVTMPNACPRLSDFTAFN